jgi:lipoprotein-releasing system permease protein
VVESGLADMQGCVVRGIQGDAPSVDRGFAQHLEWLEGSFALEEPLTIAIGVELARTMGVGVGDDIRILSLSGSGAGVAASWRTVRVSGVFRTGYYDYDVGMTFVSLATSGTLFGDGSIPVPGYGVKLASRFADREAALHVRRVLKDQGLQGAFRVESWREFNRAFFGALLLEKVLMQALPGLIFVVVAFGIFHSLKRTVYERREEIALLAALGARRSSIRAIFVLEGALIGLAGSAPGLVAGLLVSANVNGVFRVAEGIVNGALGALDYLATPFAALTSGSFSIFSPTFFYLSEVPSRVLFPEALGITCVGVLSAAVAALLASSRILGVAPAEVLRYE